MQGDQTMSDTTNDPQHIEPPVTTGGGGTTPAPMPIDSPDPETDEAQAIDPPVSTGGGG